jgi:hypothetical protein
MLDLVFDCRTLPVPTKSVFELLDHHELFKATSYGVQSSVPVEVFEAFVASLKAQTKISVTQGNAVSVWFLGKEFFLSEVSAECGTFSVSIDQFSLLFERVSSLERQISSFTNSGRQIEGEIESQKRALESLRLSLENVQSSVEGELSQLRNDLNQLPATSKPSASPSPSPPKAPDSPASVPSPSFPTPFASPSPPKAPDSPTPVPSPSSPTPSSAKSQNNVEIPMRKAKSKDGILSHLTQKHGGNIHEKGIVRITSKSVYDHPAHALKNVADVTSDSSFCSKNEPGQWVCWDFGEMRVGPTHYTICALLLKSWVVEGSLNGRSWREIDRQTDNQDFKKGLNTASFAVSNPAEFRLIRLTQTGERYCGNDLLDWCDDYLVLKAVEFFGTLSE